MEFVNNGALIQMLLFTSLLVFKYVCIRVNFLLLKEGKRSHV